MNGWQWRKPINAFPTREFHAYDGNDHAACRPSCGLVASCEEPTEFSDLCRECMGIVRAEPADPPAVMRMADA